MGKIVLELQSDALDSDRKASDLLRKAYTIARKLSFDDFEDWCNKELRGYAFDDEPKPPYRHLEPVYKAFNPYRGFIPVIIEEQETIDLLSQHFVAESVDEIETLVASDNDPLVFSVRREIQKLMMELSNAPFEVKAFVGKASYFNILQTVRNIILDWTIELEKNGVLEENLEFSNQEIRAAQGNITNSGTLIYGNVNSANVARDANNSQNWSNGPSTSEISELLSQIESNMHASGISESQREIVQKQIEEIRTELQAQVPNPSAMVSMFESIRRVFENATGSVIASGIVHEIIRMFPS